MKLRTIRIAALAAIIPLSLHGEEKTPSPELRTAPAVSSPEAEAEAEATMGPRAIVNEFFTTLGLGKVDSAYEKLAAGSMIAENTGQLSLLRTKTDQAIEEFGGIEGQELVEMEWAGTHLVRLTYLSLGEKFPLRWRFYFYRREDVWRLVDIRVDDRLKALFHESGDSEDAP
jgi:hypothetical protein